MEHTADYPEVVARFYDVIYNTVRAGTDTDFYMEEILGCGGRVLEAGTGTGRFFTEALERGADMYGIDISPAMISALRKKLPASAQHRVAVADLRTYHPAGEYRLIIAPFRVFSHIIHPWQQIQTLNNVAGMLEPGGQFIFDLYVPNFRMIAEGLDHVTDFDGEWAPGLKLRRVSSMIADPVNQISRVKMEFYWDEEVGGPRCECWEFDMRFFFRYELEHLIARSGLQLKAFYGDFHKSPLQADSREFILVCELKKQ